MFFLLFTGCDCLLVGNNKIRRLRPGRCRNNFISLCGNTVVDIREQNYPPGTKLRVFVLSLCVDIKVYVPRGTTVVVRRLMLCGDKDIDVEPDDSVEPRPRLVLTIVTLCGNVRVTSEGLVSEEE